MTKKEKSLLMRQIFALAAQYAKEQSDGAMGIHDDIEECIEEGGDNVTPTIINCVMHDFGLFLESNFDDMDLSPNTIKHAQPSHVFSL